MQSCGLFEVKQTENIAFKAKWKGICVESSGKGRIEFLENKYPFSYETIIDRSKKMFHLALDFPIVGERKLSLSLDPRIASKNVNRSGMFRMLEDSIGDRSDKEQVMQAVEEFYVLTSEFVNLKAIDKFSNVYNVLDKDGHFILQRAHGKFIYEIDSYAFNDSFFERVIFKIKANTNRQSDPILALFLVPDSCEK